MMEKRKNIKAMVKKFNDAVAKAKSEGTSVEMGRIEPVKSSLVDYRFKFWGEEFKINPLLFAILGLGHRCGVPLFRYRRRVPAGAGHDHPGGAAHVRGGSDFPHRHLFFQYWLLSSAT
jgi:uncharacterized membrane protein (DUF106 family)